MRWAASPASSWRRKRWHFTAALLPRAVRPEHLATALVVFYAFFYLCMALTQTVAGFLRDITGDASMPLLFAASLMVVTVAAVAAFWQIEARPTAGVD